VRPRPEEVAAGLPGDELVPEAQLAFDRAFDLPAPPAAVWPWLVQLGRGRAGWYLPGAVERLVPSGRRALRRIEPGLQHLTPGQVIADWGGRDATLEVVAHRAPEGDQPGIAVYRSTRGTARFSWTLLLRPTPAGSRVHSRFRMAGVRRRRLAEFGGGALDLLTIAGLAAGLRERVGANPPNVR